MTSKHLKNVFTKSLLFLALILSTSTVTAQLTGTKTIPGDYATISAFVTDLNTQGVGAGGVILEIPSGYTETAPSGGFAITASGTITDQISITCSGAVKPIITASASLTVGALNDAIFKIIGADYITISNLELRENAANTTTAAATNNMTEWGVALLYATTTNGAQNCSILGSTIELNRNYQNTFGIYSNSTHALGTVSTSASATTTAGGNSGLKIYSNAISNVNMGIVVVGPTAIADQNNGIDIGGTSALTGNTLSNYGTTGTFSGFANVSGTVNGILLRNSINLNVQYNSITSSIGGVIGGTLRGIFLPPFTNAPTATFTNTISNNSISLQSGVANGAIVGLHVDATNSSTTSTINVQNNTFSSFGHTVSGTANVTCIQNATGSGTISISGNTFNSINVNTTGTLYLINNNCSMNSFTISNNSTTGTITKSGSGGIVYGYYNFGSPTGGTAAITNNNFSNFNISGATTFYGIRQYTSTTQIENIIGNTVSNVTGGTNSVFGISHGYGAAGSEVSGNNVNTLTANASLTGIQLGDGTAGNVVCFGNQVFGLTSAAAASVNGISQNAGLTTSIYKNKIFGISSSNAGGSVNGIYMSSGTSTSIFNNIIGELTTPFANAANPLIGINIAGGTTVLVYYNTVNLSASSSGALFGSSAISVSATPNVTLRNNIFINESVFSGAGLTLAMRRSSTTLTSYNNASNNNLLYAGLPSANNLIMFDGTNSYGTLVAYQTAVLPRDANSFTGEAAFTGSGYGTAGNFFVSLSGASADFLRPVTGITTQVESGAQNISTPLITADFANVIRAGNLGYLGTGTNPDMGAYEFEGISPAPVITLNSVTPPTVSQCVAANRLISVNITTAAGTILSANIGFTVNGVPQANIPMTNTSGSTWEATLPVQVPANALIAWGVSATNSIGLSSSFTGTSYSDEPLTGVSATATATQTTICANNPSQLFANLSTAGTATIGNGVLLTGATSQPTAFCNRWPSYRMQTVYTAAELNAAGLLAGPITSIAYTITTLGDGATNANYTVLVGTTGVNSFTDFISSAGFTTVFPAATYTHAIGLNTVTFVTPYVWDGVSNLVVEVLHSGANLTNNSQTLYTTTAANTVAWSTSGGTTGTPSNQRLNVVFGGITSLAITSATWMDGMTTVGTGNPLTVNPTVTTTYTANIIASGCAVTPAPTVTVTVNPLPTAPTAVNSAQCGTQIPSVSVTSTSGLPTPTFIWYDAAVAGTAMQNSTSTTYTSNVASTTTFYVAELNTLTGCESARTPVTVTVAIADGITASADNAAICIGSPVVLSVVNNNGTPNQTYSYTWTNAETGSGLISQTGSSITVTPTQPGTYIYDVVGLDGGCSAVSSISVTVNPFLASISPINVSCNSGNDGSFSLASSSCGTAPFDYSINGGAFGAIPTNMIAGVYTVVVMDDNGYISATLPLTITEPSTTITNPTVTNTSVCQNDLSALVTASATTSVPTPATQVISFDLASQPNEVNAAPGAVISSATMTALPASAIVTSVTLAFPGTISNGGSYQSEIRLGVQGAVLDNAVAGTGAASAAGLYNYTRVLPNGSVTVGGGNVDLLYWNAFDDEVGGDATFPTGLGVATLTINYTFPTPATITWWDAPTGGTQIGTGSPFETVGTSVLPTTSTAGVVTLYAQGQNGICPSPGRTTATVTVNAASTSTTPITACNTYTWTNGTTYTVGGTHTQVLTNAVGCDSTATLVLTINNSSTSSTPITACDSYAWTNGTTYTVGGTYTQVLTNAVGCDSTATLVLTINNSTTSTTIVTECDAYTWTNGTNYTVGGTYTQVLTNTAGCDSTATLILTINNSTTSTTTVTECDSYTWTNGTNYTVGGTYTQVLTNAAGCDSTATLVLTINNSSTSTTTVTACDSYSWTNGTIYTVGGTYTQVLTNAAGCDSTATLVLIINNSTTSTTTVTACDSYTWTNGTNYTVGGTYTQLLTNAIGCDSTATLVLTINVTPTATATDNGDATITASAGSTYQWIDCATLLPISGANAQTFTATVNGSYAVEVSNGACTNTSSCVVINYIGIKEITQDVINLYPNPTRDNVTVSMSATSAKVEIIDAQGKSLETSTLVNGGLVSLANYDRGVYFLRITTENGSSLHRVIKN